MEAQHHKGSAVPAAMREELLAGVEYVVSLANRRHSLDPQKLEIFREELTALLCQKYTGHWYPDRPTKGQAYRCIRLSKEHPADASLLQACVHSGLVFAQLTLPKVMTLWIDPYEVCCRLGENTRHYTVASFEWKKPGSKKTPTKELETSDYFSDTSSDVQSASSSDDEGTGTTPRRPPAPALSAQVHRSVYRATPLWVPDWRMAQAYLTVFHTSGYFYPDIEMPMSYSPVSVQASSGQDHPNEVSPF
ncbi:maternal B9.15 protein-like [Lissotriton helveticus]